VVTKLATRGVVYIHSAPSALCPHIEWAVGGVLGAPVSLDWTPQPAQSGAYRAEQSWTGEAGAAAAIASALRGWNHLRFEITEEPTASSEGSRYSYTPELGVFHAVTGLHGLVEVHRLVTGAAPGDDVAGTVLAPWWRAYAAALRACALVVEGTPRVGTPECTETFTDVEVLVRAAIDSGDTHSVKLVVALRRLVELGLVDEPTLLELGAIKLAVDECDA